MPTIRDATPSDYPEILRLNEAEVQHTSAMDHDRLQSLVDWSTYCKVVTVDGQVAAFLIAMRDGAPYENENFGWFAQRFTHYLYVDRIVVDAQYAGRSIGSLLYRDLFEYARSNDIDTVTCEYNIDPPNLPSKAFHDRFGFEECGSQWLDGGAKRVSLQAVRI